MHKKVYASGFIYFLPTQQILLQQSSSDKSITEWELFGGVTEGKETPIETFHRIINDVLHIAISLKDIQFVYDYFHEGKKLNAHIHFVPVNVVPDNLKVKKGVIVSPFSFKQLHKLGVSEQTKQDITVGQRVINAIARSLEESSEATS